MVKDRRSKDQKRKDKLAKKARKSRKADSLAYMGEKYKSDELIPLWMETEIGIYESYVMTDRTLLDATVVTALETLVKKIRAGTMPPLDDTETVRYEAGQEQDLVIGNIRRRWADHFETKWCPPKSDRIGVLRTILGSIEKMRAPGPRSQSYMHHIAGFLTRKLGVSVQQVSAEGEPLPQPEEGELLQLGRRWIEGNPEARAEFYLLAQDMIGSGLAEPVINTCHHLLGKLSDPSSEFVAELSELSNHARTVHISEMS